VGLQKGKEHGRHNMKPGVITIQCRQFVAISMSSRVIFLLNKACENINMFDYVNATASNFRAV